MDREGVDKRKDVGEDAQREENTREDDKCTDACRENEGCRNIHTHGQADDGSQAPHGTGNESETKKETAPRQAWWRQRYPLPSWCLYVAWVLAVATVVASAFFVILYGFQFGKEKSEAWLSALVFSFVESVILVQPFKVALIGSFVVTFTH